MEQGLHARQFNIVKGTIRQYCFVYMKPFNFMNSQNDVKAILSCPGFGSHGAIAKKATGGLWYWHEQRK